MVQSGLISVFVDLSNSSCSLFFSLWLVSPALYKRVFLTSKPWSGSSSLIGDISPCARTSFTSGTTWSIQEKYKTCRTHTPSPTCCVAIISGGLPVSKIDLGFFDAPRPALSDVCLSSDIFDVCAELARLSHSLRKCQSLWKDAPIPALSGKDCYSVFWSISEVDMFASSSCRPQLLASQRVSCGILNCLRLLGNVRFYPCLRNPVNRSVWAWKVNSPVTSSNFHWEMFFSSSILFGFNRSITRIWWCLISYKSEANLPFQVWVNIKK